jgi:hypothetical protein
VRRQAALALGMATFGLAACTHLEVWESAEYVHPGSVEYTRLAERLDTLYTMSCRVPGSDGQKRYIINGTRVAMEVPPSQDCTKAIPYAICYARADQDPNALCRRIDTH